jgi:hypothetical protein
VTSDEHRPIRVQALTPRVLTTHVPDVPVLVLCEQRKLGLDGSAEHRRVGTRLYEGDTPSISLNRSVTMMSTPWVSCSPSSTDDPVYSRRVPGRSGYHRWLTLAESPNQIGS